MATTSGGERCKHCWRPMDCSVGSKEWWLPKNHNVGCPVVDRRLSGEWNHGYRYGFDDNHIQPWRYRNYSVTFLMGYQVGKAEIDRLVDDAAQSRCFG